MTQTTGKLFIRTSNILETKKAIKQAKMLGDCRIDIEVYMNYEYFYQSVKFTEAECIIGFDVHVFPTSSIKPFTKKIKKSAITGITIEVYYTSL